MTADEATPDDLTRGHDSHFDPLKERFSKMTMNQDAKMMMNRDDDKVPLLKPVEQAKEDGTCTQTHTQIQMYASTHCN